MAILMKYHVEGDINSQFVCYKSPIWVIGGYKSIQVHITL
jgi:hypothetical protein